jgi:PAS domain S-box-containing protein
MNVVFVSGDPKEADVFKQELTNSAPAIHVEISATTLDAMIRLGNPGMCEVLVMDASLPRTDILDLVSYIREDKRPVGIVVVAGADQKEFLADLIKSGVDHFVFKRPGYPAHLPEMFQKLKERYQTDSVPKRKELRLLFAGNMEGAQHALANATQLKFEQAVIAPDGSFQPEKSGTIMADAIILDFALTGAQTVRVIKEAAKLMPEIPIVLLTEPGDDETVIAAMRSGAADCITKAGNYWHRLLLVLQREIGRREILRDRSAIGDREERLRHIVESLPACITMIAPDGSILAINNAGLKLMGAGHLDEVVGKNIIDLILPEDRDRILASLAEVCRGNSATVRVSWKGLNGIRLSTDLRAVPMRRDATGSTAALAVLYPSSSQQKSQITSAEEDKLEHTAKEYEARLRDSEGKQSEPAGKWVAALQESESKRIAAEKQQEVFKSAADDNAARYARLVEEQRSERDKWEQAQRELREQCLKIEGVAQALQSAQANLLENHNSEKAAWERRSRELEDKQKAAQHEIDELSEALQLERSNGVLLRQELEQKYGTVEENKHGMETALQSASSSLAQLVERHAAELAQRDFAGHELDRKFQAAEQQRIGLETALRQKESDFARLIEKCDAAYRALEEKHKAAETQILTLQSEQQNAALSRNDAAIQELEQRGKALEAQIVDLQSELQNAKNTQRQSAELHASEIARREATGCELEQKLHRAEEQLQNAQSSEFSLAQLRHTHEAELSKRDLAQQDIEAKYREAEKQNLRLQSAVQVAEFRLSQLTERRRNESLQQDTEQKKAEEKFQAAEKKRLLLEDALKDVQRELEQLARVQDDERTQWEAAKRELEEKCRSAEKQLTIVTQNATREAESHIAWIAEQNQAKALQIEKLQQEMEQLKLAYGQLESTSSDFHLRNQRLTHFTSVGVVLATLDGRVIECNDAAARMFGYQDSKEALSGTGKDQFRLYAFEGLLAARLKQDGKLANIEWSSLDRRGRVVRVHENASLIRSTAGEGPHVERILTDISRIHKLSEEVRRARRLESTGELAATTVSSLKDICSSLANAGTLLEKASEDSATVRRLAETVLNDANLGIKHARQFLSAAMKTDRAPALVALNEVLTDNLALLHNLIDSDIELQPKLAPQTGLVSAERGEIAQLISNLVAGSREILPLGGTMTVETSNIDVDALTPGSPQNLQPGTYVRVLFTFDGCVVQPEWRIDYSRNLVERMGGYLETAGDPKTGAVYTVYLPRVETCAVGK